jgi:hypothetical protein
MNRLTAALAAATMLGIAGPVAAQSMQGMDHSAMPGMTMPIDPDAELTPIGGMGRGAMVLVARPDAPFRDRAGFIA